MVLFLLEKGADLNIKDKTGRNAFDIAKICGRQKTIETIEKYQQKLTESNPRYTKG